MFYNRYVKLVVIFFLSTPFLLSAAEMDEIELVESYPLETTLDIDSVRNTLEVWQELITNSCYTLDIESFYFSTSEGEPLEVILEDIKQAAQRGVNVRIISEKKFHKTYPEPLNSLDKCDNIEVRIIDFGQIARGIMHAKYFIVDGEQVFLGSQNFDWRSLKHIHELGIRLKNKAIARLFTELYESDWILAEDNSKIKDVFNLKNYPTPVYFNIKNRNIPVIPVFSPKNFLPDSNQWDEPRIVELIDGAKQEVNIQLLNYSPVEWGKTYYAVLDNALRRAAARGVKVKLLCSDWSKSHPKIDYLKSLQLVPNIEVKLSTIPEYSGGFISYARVEHCKYLVVDDNKFWIGTGNWSMNYFYNSRNVGVIIDDQKLAKTVATFFDNSWDSPYAYLIDPCKDYQPPRTRDE